MIEQPSERDAHSGSEPIDHGDGGVAGAPLDVADVRAVQPDLERERFLRKPALGPELTKVPGEALADIHERQVAAMSPNGLQTMSDIRDLA